MKRKILLLILTLGFLECISAQTPKVVDDGYHLMPGPNPVMYKVSEANKNDTSTTQRTHRAKEDAIMHNVDFVLDFDTENQNVSSISLINNDYQITASEQGVTLEAGSNVLSVPQGTYDILITFYQLDLTQEDPILYTMYVIREQVAIDGDMQLNISASEAKNHIHFQTLTPNGEPVNTGTWMVDDDYTNWIEIIPGNTDDVWFYQRIYNKEYGELVSYYGTFSNIIEGGPHHRVGKEAQGDFFVNDVSERYAFYTHRVGYKGRDFFTTAYEVEGASDDITITNDPSDYALFTDPFVINNHPNEDLYTTINFYVAQGNQSFPWITFWLASPLAEDEISKYYIGAKSETSNVGYMPFIEPFVSTKELLFGVLPDMVPALASMRLTNTVGQAIFANNGVASVTSRGAMMNLAPDFSGIFSEEQDMYGRDITNLPLYSTFNPAFSYSVEKKVGRLGNNCPALVSMAEQYELIDEWEDEDGSIYTERYCALTYNYDYIGRYGEKSDDLIKTASVKVDINGEEFYTGNDSYIELEDLIDGEADITISNNVFMVDDMASSNITKMHLTTSTEDQCTPTLTMLHFKASNDDVTDRFNRADEGTLEFSAGDFNSKISPLGWDYYDRFAPESVEVSYSPYSEGNWNELTIEELPEFYWPVMGWFYRGSLAGVTGEAYEGWFDLKIRLVDAAGNWQEQVLSPAFRIDNLAYSSVANVGSDNAREVARYSLDGKRVDASHHGVTIIKMSDGTAKKMIVQ